MHEANPAKVYNEVPVVFLSCVAYDERTASSLQLYLNQILQVIKLELFWMMGSETCTWGVSARSARRLTQSLTANSTNGAGNHHIFVFIKHNHNHPGIILIKCGYLSLNCYPRGVSNLRKTLV